MFEDGLLVVLVIRCDECVIFRLIDLVYLDKDFIDVQHLAGYIARR
jgi:hypothetical protein